MNATPASSSGELYLGDALAVCEALGPDVSFDLVYLDPPFNAGGTFSARLSSGQTRGRRGKSSGPDAYRDSWGGRSAFLEMLAPRLEAIRRRMSARATLWLHLDQRVVHYAKVLCDDLFGASAFRGEVIWSLGNGARGKRGPSATHQTLLVYTKDARSRGEYTWNAEDPSLREPYAKTSTDTHFRKRDESGRLYRERRIGGRAYRYFLDEGRRLGSVWTDIPSMIANTPLCAESTGYPTQKPERLLERIVRASSHEGDVVADLMCGSATTLVIAARLGRRFIGADASPLATQVARARLERDGIPFQARQVGSEEVWAPTLARAKP